MRGEAGNTDAMRKEGCDVGWWKGKQGTVGANSTIVSDRVFEDSIK